VNIVLTILDELDSQVFERIDSSASSLETLSSRLFGHSQFFGHEEILLHTLCDWAVSAMRSGEHRAFVVAKLLERRQAKLIQDNAPVQANSANAESSSSNNATATTVGNKRNYCNMRNFRWKVILTSFQAKEARIKPQRRRRPWPMTTRPRPSN